MEVNSLHTVTKMKTKGMREEIEIPGNIEFDVVKEIITIKNNQGEISRKFRNPNIIVSKEGRKIIITSKKLSKREKMYTNTLKAHIKNMIKGITNPYIYKLKICSGHFPMNVSVQGNYLMIKNFYGEKIPRKAKILDGVKVELEGDIILVKGYDKDLVGQTCGNIERATRRVGFDKRIYQDGIYITEKPGRNVG